MKAKITFHNGKGKALTPQTNIDMFNFPFTLNNNIGCLYGCRYCYLQKAPYCKHAEFGKEVKVKTWIPEVLDKELTRFSELPQHLKRVQTNPATEGFHPWVLSQTRTRLGRDIMTEILEVFEQQWQNGNQWMIHIVTKSNYITKYIDLLKRMRHMIQVEITIITAENELSRQFEPLAPSINARLKAINKLAREDIFVRVMAMPVIVEEGIPEEEVIENLTILKDLAFDNGARAFKNKGLNYFNAADVRQGNAKVVRQQDNKYYKTLQIKSGEPALPERNRNVLMPRAENKKNWAAGHYNERLVNINVPIVNFGYNNLNNGIDWSNII